MNGIRGRVAVLVLVVAAFAAGGLLAARDVSAVPQPSAVTVVNGTDAPVPTSVVGTPTVNVGGTVAVQQVRQPFQQFVGKFSSGGEACDQINVPAGKRLVLESFSAEANGTSGAGEPHVYLMITAAAGGGSNFVRSNELDLKPAIDGFAGVMNVLLHTGSPAPGPETYAISACVVRGDGATFGSFRGFVSGWLEDA